MNFNQLSLSAKLVIIGELSGVKLYRVMASYNYVNKGVTTGFTGKLATHGLSRDVLENLHNAQIHVDFGVPSHNTFLSNVPSVNYLNINRSPTQTSDNPLVLRFSSRVTKDELGANGLDSAGVNGAIVIREDDDIRDVFTAAQNYISAHTSNTEVTQVLEQFIEGYGKALSLPTDLLERLVTWTPISRIIDSLTSKIAHSYSDYYSGDDNDDDGRIPLPQGRNVFNIHRIFANGGGFTVGYDHSAVEYTGYRMSLGYVPCADSDGGKFKIGLTYNNIDNVTLNETDVNSDISAVDVIDVLITAFTEVKKDEQWGKIATPLIDHVVNSIVEVKPFVLATLK